MPDQQKTEFSASWGMPLKAMTGFFVVIFAFLVGVDFSRLGPPMPWARELLLGIPVLVGIVSAFYMVRGYSLQGTTLGIQRLGWVKTFNLTNLVSAQADPDALRASVRVFGNGGLFSFCGWYRNKKLGMYRAYVTDARHAVVLRFSDKTVVVTPDESERFVNEVTSLLARR